MLGHRLRRWPSIKSTQAERLDYSTLMDDQHICQTACEHDVEKVLKSYQHIKR